MIVELISVGTELLLGDILNRNVQFLSQACAELGFDIFHTSVVGDNPKRLRAELEQALERSDLVITTGGLGPTSDDITLSVVYDIIGYNYEVYPNGYLSVCDRMTVLKNHHGVADGYMLEHAGKRIAVLPGPPKEMNPMFTDQLKPHLLALSDGVTKSLWVKMAVMGETAMHKAFEARMLSGSNPTFAPYAKTDGALIRVTAKAKSESEADRLLSGGLEELKAIYGERIINTDGGSKSELLVRMLADRGEHVATCESVTGGMVAAEITDNPGSSAVFEAGYVTYSDAQKMAVLGVPEALLKRYTAVSAEVAEAMAEGLHRLTGAELCLSTTGYAGPTGESVGLVYIGVCYRGKTAVYKDNYHPIREMVRNRTRNSAIDLAILAMRREKV